MANRNGRTPRRVLQERQEQRAKRIAFWGLPPRVISPNLHPLAHTHRRVAYGEEGKKIIKATPPFPRRRKEIPFGVFLLLVGVAALLGGILFWLWWGTLPR